MTTHFILYSMSMFRFIFLRSHSRLNLYKRRFLTQIMGICGSVDEGEVPPDQNNQSGAGQDKRGSLQYPPGLAPKEYVIKKA